MKKFNFKMKNQNTKSSKGITLVALIITIIILLILAVVAIAAVNNTGIINYADNSADQYKDGRDKENGILQGYVDYLNENDPTRTKSVLYGSTYYGFEFITETTGKVYIPGINDNGYLDVTFSGNKIMYEGESMGEYSIYTLENNRILSMDDYEFFSTNGLVGLDNSSLDGKTYTYIGEENKARMKFENGKTLCFEGSINGDEYSYYILESYILQYYEELGCFVRRGKDLSDDYSTFVMSGSDILILQQ